MVILNSIKKGLLLIFKILLALYIVVCGLLFFFQERLIFFPQKLDKSYQFQFEQNFEEINISSEDGVVLNGLLFKADSSKGLIFYLHGNSGSVASYGNIAKTYTDLSYDVFILDYRSFGKSGGKINNQNQLFQDNQIIYDELKKMYREDDIVILGYSIGTGLATKLASQNNPKRLILEAPYYSLIDMMKHTYSFAPTFMLKYKFETNEYLKECDMPISIFHGTQDNVIYFESSLKLKEEFGSKITLTLLENQGHNGIASNKIYKPEPD
ncbi:MAG: alpha/beta fold hydrolase [Cyclobacteriaceae bacterium]